MNIAQNRGYVQDVRVENCSLHFRHFRHPWRSYTGFASLHGCSLVEQCRSNCRGALTGYVQDVLYSGFAGAKTGYVKHAMMALLMPRNATMAVIAESTTYS